MTQLTASNFNLTGSPTAQDIANFNAALAYLQNGSPIAAAKLNDFASSHLALNIGASNIDNYNVAAGMPGFQTGEAASTVFWDAGASLIIPSNTTGNGTGIRSAAVLLMHEIYHALDPTTSAELGQTNSTYDNEAEHNAVLFEDSVATQLGEVSRFNHQGTYIFNGNSTDHTTAALNPDGTQNWQEQLFNGAVTVTSGKYTVGSNPIMDVVPGSETGANTFSANNAAISINSAGSFTLAGSSNQVTMLGGSTVATSGSAETLTCGANSVFVNGTETATCSTSNTLSVNGNNVIGAVTTGNVSFTGGGDYVTVGTGASISVNASAADTIVCNGQSSTVTGAASATCTASGLTINSSSGTITTGATNVTIDESNTTITLTAGANVTITGSNDTVIFAAGATASVYGLNDNVSLNSNDTLTLPGQVSPGSVDPTTNVTVNGGGTGDVVNCGSEIGATLNISGATINSTLYSGGTAGIFINGNSDHVNSNGAGIVFNGTNDSITLNGTNNFVVGAAGSNVIITDGTGSGSSCQLQGSDATFGLNGHITSTLYGDADTINATTNDLINLRYGQGDVLNGIFAGDQVDMWNDTSATIQGSGGMVDVMSTGTTVTASNENVEFTSLSGGALHDNLFGSHDVLSDPGVNGLSALTIEGQYDTGSLDQIITTVYGNDTGDTFTDPGGSFYDNTNTGSWDFGTGDNDVCSDGFDPVILNLKGGAVSTVGLASSSAYFDMENTGAQIHTGWGTAGEGYLVDDVFNTNTVTNEHSLISSFDELKGLDSNNDGVLNAQDAAWSHMKVWTDTAGNGTFVAGSMQTLSALGIASINLHSTHSGRNSNNNTILDDSTFTWNNGTTGAMAGVAFTFDQNTVHTTGGGGGGGGGGAACVQVASLLPGGGTAGEIKAGDRMELADEATLAAGVGSATYSERKTAPGYRIVTVSGISLVCSDSAPIPTRDGLILAPALMGHDVAVRKDEGGSSLVGWEKVASVTAVGTIEIQHISINDKCFWAGEQKDAFILHHNKRIP